MYAVIGEVGFDLITYFDGVETRFGVDYAEHARIGLKPRLQWVGEKLDEVSIQLTFHMSFCDPEDELLKLRDAMTLRDVLPLVLGNGDYKGRFVITQLTATSRQTDKVGTLIALDASMTLREQIEDDPAEAERRRAQAEAAKKRRSLPWKSDPNPPVPRPRPGEVAEPPQTYTPDPEGRRLVRL